MDVARIVSTTPRAPRLGRATMPEVAGDPDRPSGAVEIRAGEVLQRGVLDPARAGAELVQRTWKDWTLTRGLVAFVRRGDAWDAVTMVAVDRQGRTEQLWAPWSVTGLRLDRSARVDAIWQVSPYGFDTRLGQPDSMFPQG